MDKQAVTLPITGMTRVSCVSNVERPSKGSPGLPERE